MPRSKLVPLLAGVAVVIVVAIGAGLWWADRQKYESTDNAFVEADTAPVSSLIAGHVAEVLVSDNQHVEPGQVLARLEPTDFRDHLAQARANLAAAEAAVKSVDDKAALETSMIAERAAGVTSAEASARTADLDMKRYGKLAEQGWVSDQGLQSAKSQQQQTAANVVQAQASLEAEQRAAASLNSAKAQNLAQVQAARAAVQQAATDLDRTEIKAPIAGVVGARSVRPGQYVQPGVTLMAVVPLGRTYVVANFKETQVARMRIGQAVEIRADAFDQPIRGHIDSFAPATGQEFALIPVENAVGNFTKITQRVPVKIAVEPQTPLASGLRPGLSVVVKVDVTGRTGPSFAEIGSPPVHFAGQGTER